jgi:hypothetical protein
MICADFDVHVGTSDSSGCSWWASFFSSEYPLWFRIGPGGDLNTCVDDNDLPSCNNSEFQPPWFGLARCNIDLAGGPGAYYWRIELEVYPIYVSGGNCFLLGDSAYAIFVSGNFTFESFICPDDAVYTADTLTCLQAGAGASVSAI